MTHMYSERRSVVTRIALVLIVTLVMGAAKLLACELGCPATAANEHATACHEESSSGPTLTAHATHDCDHETPTAAITAQKTHLLQTGASQLVDLLPRVWDAASTMTSVRPDLPAPPLSRSSATRTLILRI